MEITGFPANHTGPDTAGERTEALFDGSVSTKMYADGLGVPTAARAFGASKDRLATGNRARVRFHELAAPRLRRRAAAQL